MAEYIQDSHRRYESLKGVKPDTRESIAAQLAKVYHQLKNKELIIEELKAELAELREMHGVI